MVLQGVPVGLWHRSRQWFEGLLREFTIIAAGADDQTPQALLDFVADADDRFAVFSTASNREVHRAYDAGEDQLDVEIDLPSEAGPVAAELLTHLHEANRFCARGDLLTLVADTDVLAFIQWYLTEISRQLAGGAPEAWGVQPAR